MKTPNAMKRLTLTLAFLLSAAFALQANPVDPDLTLRAARLVLQRSDVAEVTPKDFAGCRLYVGSDGTGFVLLADDDCVRPLLGYSLTASWPVDDNPMPEHVASWMEGYQREIASAKANGGQPSRRAADEWAALLAGCPKSVTSEVRPLIKSEWGQGESFTYFCPYDSAAGKRCLTGCVATAGAQLLKYWKHPEVGRGSHSYNHKKYGTLSARFDTTYYPWNRMPNKITDITMQENRENISLLMYHYGVAVDMTYGPSSSGAHTNPLGKAKQASSETALKEYFRYNPALFTAYKEGFTDAGWRAMIDEDLDSARPVLYDGYGDAGGHAFVLDGRDTLGLYHFNWGWDGSYNGFFTLDSLSPSSSMSFSRLNSAIFRIFPIEVNDATATLTAVSDNPARGSVSGGGTYPVDSMRVFLLATPTPGYRFDHWTSGNPANPIFTSPTCDMADTAVFVPIHRDTLGYCRPNGIAYKNSTDEDSVEWGIRIPAMYLDGKQTLRQVQFWTYEAFSPYIVRLFRGQTPLDTLYTDTIHATGYGMNTLDIPASVDIDFADTTPLWVTVYARGSSTPISYSHFTGSPDGSWVRYHGVWQYAYDALSLYGSWMLRVVLDPPTHTGIMPVEGADPAFTVRVEGRTVSASAADGSAVALYDVMGRRLGSHTAGTLRCTVPAAGVYVLRSGSAGRKIVVL